MKNIHTALVVGANGVIGKNLVAYLQSTGSWKVIGTSRKPASKSAGIAMITVDLLDATNTAERFAHLSDVTHIFYTAYQDAPTWAELVAPNMTMFRNVVETMEKVSPVLQHISFMQGYKVYGAHLGPFKTPAREDDPPIMLPEFMTEQQRYITKAQEGKSWAWSAMRPSVVGGFSPGNPLNLVSLIAVYAAISKELHVPFRFPGKPGAYHHLTEMTDADLLAKATVWAATNAESANQAFNINNGDLFRWEDLWPKIGRYFGIETAPPVPLPLAEVMRDKAPVWEALVKKHGLQYDYQTMSAWPFGDFVFSWDYDFLADGSKARRLGFHEFADTEQMFYRIFDQMKADKIIP
jgi:nucleoside-diphosphate-sugar epimerase